MKQAFQIISLLAFILASCKPSIDHSKVDKEPSSEEKSFPILIDTFELRTTQMSVDRVKTANYNPLFIGPWKDTVFVNYRLLPGLVAAPPPEPPLPTESEFAAKRKTSPKPFLKPMDLRDDEIERYFYHWEDHSDDNYRSLDSSTVEIFIDTTKTIRNIDFKEFQDSTYAYLAYPVLLTNHSSDTVIIGYGVYTPILMEAQDTSGVWTLIEQPYRYGCGNGVTTTILPPSECLLTSAVIYTGEFKTLLRLRLGKSGGYSNTFLGSVNMNQFDTEPK